MRLGTVISHPSLGRKVYVSQLLEDGTVILIDQALSEVGSFGDMRHLRFLQNLETGLITPEGFSDAAIGRRKDLEGDDRQAKPLTVLVVARLLDENVDSKQLFQALKDEGVVLEGLTLFRNYLGKWKVRDERNGEAYSIMTLINTLEE